MIEKLNEEAQVLALSLYNAETEASAIKTRLKEISKMINEINRFETNNQKEINVKEDRPKKSKEDAAK